jgi:predicted AAA+ superfamily ATPase
MEKIGAVFKIGKTNQIHTNIVKEFKINSHQIANYFSKIKNAYFIRKIPEYQRKIALFFDFF